MCDRGGGKLCKEFWCGYLGNVYLVETKGAVKYAYIKSVQSTQLSIKQLLLKNISRHEISFNPLTPNDDYSSRTALQNSKYVILYIYSTDIGTEYFKHGIYTPYFPLQNAVCFINLTYLVPLIFTFYIQVC